MIAMDLLYARMQMALSLGFHIIFAAVGIAMPFFMAVSHYRWLRTRDPLMLQLTKAWSRGVAIFFATGAVSGTALSLELGLLWPRFMEHAGPIIGMPFSWEGTAFFLEAIAIGMFLYGWKRLHPWVHWGSGLIVGIAGVASGMFVVCANAWMNAPTGFDWVDGRAINIDPVRAMFNQAALLQGIHMTIAAFQAVAFAVGGIHAFLFLRNPSMRVHAEAVKIAVLFGIGASLLQPLAGHFLAEQTARLQPVKLAAMESHFETQPYAPLLIGGWPDIENKSVAFAIKIPGALSILAHGAPSAVVQGLEDFPRSEWPPVRIVHCAFQVMVGIGMFLLGVSGWILFARWKHGDWVHNKKLLRVVSLCTPLGVLALEAGWVVTEVGRQPWIIYRVMKTAEAVTPMRGLQYPFFVFLSLYLFLSAMLVWLMVRQIRQLHREKVET